MRSGGWRGPTPIPLPDLDPLDPVRITLLARAEGGESDGGIELTRPVLRAAPEPTAPVLPPEADARLSALREAGRGRPPVLIYLIDTLRADHLGSYGYHLDTSPNLDAFADDAVRFSRSTAQSGWTRTSVASIFTGLHPRSHDVNDREDMMSSSAVTLATVLRANGYDTTGFITNGNVAATFGLDHGFDTYVYLRERKTDEIHVQSDELNERALGWLEARDVDRPFFLYLHSVDPHDPYTPRSPFRERFIETQQFPELATLRNLFRTPAADRDVPALSQELTALYDAEIAFNDHHFGELIRWLKANALYEQTLLLVMSDHGEAFYEHGRWGHGNSLYQELISVPLLVKLPGQVGAGLVIDEPAQHVDAMPTILDLLDIPIPDAVQGRSLLPAVASGQVDPTTQTTAYLQLDTRHLESVQTIRRKLIRHPMSDRTGGRVELYDLVDDPFELQDLAGTRAVARRHLMVELMEAALARPTLLETSEAVIDAELEDRLRALGYVR
ncbi:MAG: sulfatase [Dehalococcoidia bacterium]|nr:sulfatase [Dehalococcoidia bacterium]